MGLDFIGNERQFIDHLAPVWRALPLDARGRFLVDEALVVHAAQRGVLAEAIDADALRRSSQPPTANPGAGPMAVVASIGDTKIARRLGYRRFAFLEHGAAQSYAGAGRVAARNPSYSGGGDREDTELFLVPNEQAAERWRQAYPGAAVRMVGCPKIDELPRLEPGPGPVVALTFHWPAYVCPEAGTALGHYIRVLPDLAKAFPSRIIGHAHPKGDWPKAMERYYRRAGVPFVADFEDVCRRADVLVADNTSAMFEFAATGRPVVLLNSPEYRLNVTHGLRFEPADGCPQQAGLHFCGAAHVGIQVNDPDALIPAVQDALQDPPERQMARESALSRVYQPRSGGAALAATALVEWMAARQAVAA